MIRVEFKGGRSLTVILMHKGEGIAGAAECPLCGARNLIWGATVAKAADDIQKFGRDHHCAIEGEVRAELFQRYLDSV